MIHAIEVRVERLQKAAHFSRGPFRELARVGKSARNRRRVMGRKGPFLLRVIRM